MPTCAPGGARSSDWRRRMGRSISASMGRWLGEKRGLRATSTSSSTSRPDVASSMRFDCSRRSKICSDEQWILPRKFTIRFALRFMPRLCLCEHSARCPLPHTHCRDDRSHHGSAALGSPHTFSGGISTRYVKESPRDSFCEMSGRPGNVLSGVSE